MEKVIIASVRKSAGKTSAIVGITAAAKKKIAYAKPFGERMLYRKKRLWDYDSSLISALFGLKEDPVDMSIGFDHSKLRYMYDEEGTRKKLMETIGSVADDRDIINKVQNLEEFQSTHVPVIRQMGIPVMGVIPYQSELTQFTVSYLSERLFAKVLCGEGGLNRVVKNILIGAWSANVFLQNPVFKKENKLVITGGDRTDMILASLESDTSAIILTNNILPPSNIISKASERNIPLLMVFSDTYQTAKQIEGLEPLLTKDDGEKVEMLKTLFQEHVNIREIVGK
jgi:BioD-like phosphotransacetylase family protein